MKTIKSEADAMIQKSSEQITKQLALLRDTLRANTGAAPKMTAQQVRRLRSITNRIQQRYVFDYKGPAFVFNVIMRPDGSLTFSAHNQTPDARWYDTYRNICLNMGPRGGVHWHTEENVDVKFVTDRC